MARARGRRSGGRRQDRLQDPYTLRARREGFRARSVYKLQAIDRRFRLLRRGLHVLDLGCAPGSWLQYVSGRVGSTGRILGVDLKAVELKSAAGDLGPGVVLMRADVFAVEPRVLLGGGERRFDVVLSDMAPDTSGSRVADHARSVALCRRAFAIGAEVLAAGGAFVCKVLDGEDVPGLVSELRSRFGEVRRFRPESTRKHSTELFVVARGFSGGAG